MRVEAAGATMNSRFHRTAVGLWAMSFSLLLGGCAKEATQHDMDVATAGYVEDTSKLFVVDCLLPGQVRRLGTQMTYLSQRRPIRTTAADCEVRGGEYVAYDRANYASALKVWLPKAQEGDAAAQVYVGEIFEKGLGQAIDYQAAQQWYQKAAKQGNSQAQLNLGHLYEKGLGVAQDAQQAMSWYRKAAGLDVAGLQFAPAVTSGPQAASVPAATGDPQELKSLRDEAASLRRQLNESQQQVLNQQSALRNAQDELEQTRQKLETEKGAAADSGEVKTLQEDLRRKQAELKTQQSRMNKMMAAMTRDREAARRELDAARKQKSAPVSAGASDKGGASSASLETSLNEKVASYQKRSSELTQWLMQDGGASDPAMRARISERKQQLQADAQEINKLKEEMDRQSTPGSVQLASGGPSIQLIDPPLTMTRGMPTIMVTGTERHRSLTGKVTSSAGLDKVFVNQQPVDVDASGVFRAGVDVGSKQTSVEIRATDRNRKESALTVTLLAGGAASDDVVAAGGGDSRPLQKGNIDFGRYYALIIGNASYTAYPALRTPVADAKSLDVVLRERYGFKTKVLINANRHAIMSALNEISKKLTDQDNLLVYYAGHGEIDKATQSAYWLPTDAETGNSANWISSQSITEFLSIMPARHIMVVADSCYAGALTGSAVARLPEGMDESKREKWLKVMNTRKARTVLTSGGVQPVMDEGGGDHSVFAKAFLTVLRSNQRVLEDYDVFRSVAGQVSRSASSAGFEQKPQYAPLQHAGHEGSPFFFVPSV
jgi:hypothetical protein